MDTQAFRRSLHHSDRYNRRGFDSPTKRAQALEEAYQSDLINSIRNNSFTYKKGRLKIKLAQAFGFCWGVERAVAMAYETRRHYPNENIWITNEIIHNQIKPQFKLKLFSIASNVSFRLGICEIVFAE